MKRFISGMTSGNIFALNDIRQLAADGLDCAFGQSQAEGSKLGFEDAQVHY